MDSDEPFFQLCTNLSLSTHVSPSNTVSWMVTRKRTSRLMRDWLAKCATRQLHSQSSSEDDIHTIWTDQNKNFGLRVKVEDRRLALGSADSWVNIYGVEQAANYDMHIKGVFTSLHRPGQKEIQKKE